MMLTIYLIRHTEVAVGRSICYGGSDVELAENYAFQLSNVASHLFSSSVPDVIFSSPLTRCRLLAEGLSAPEQLLEEGMQAPRSPVLTKRLTSRRTPIPLQFDDRLREYNFGDWEMRPWSDIPREALDAWMADFVNLAPHNGDSFQAVYDRAGAFWREKVIPLAGAETEKTVYIVSHGGVIRALLCLILELPLQNAYRLHLDYGAVSKLTVQNGTYTVGFINR